MMYGKNQRQKRDREESCSKAEVGTLVGTRVSASPYTNLESALYAFYKFVDYTSFYQSIMSNLFKFH